MSFADLFDSPLFLPIAAGVGAVAAVWLVLDLFLSGRPRVEERLDEFRDPGARRRKDENKGATAAVSRIMEQTAPSLGKHLQPKTEKDAHRLKERLLHAGFRGENAQAIFLGLKVMGLIVGAVFAGSGLLVIGYSLNILLRCVGVALVMFFIPDLVVALMGKSRKQQIFLGLPDALDLLVVCVEAGLGLDQALRKVVEEMKKSYRTISEEFGLCNLQLQMGRPRTEALQELGYRTGVEDLRVLASTLIQADKFGSSVAQALRVQSESMRTRRRQIAEEKAAKTAVKLIFPLVIFIFPGIFVVLVGPAGISMYREMFTAMNGGS